MTALHVCPLSRIEDVMARSSAGWVVSILTAADQWPALPTVPAAQRLQLALSDITTATPDHVLAARSHIEAFLSFLARWDRGTPLLIHCYAGVSRSTATAFVALCALDPATSEADHAGRLRAASPTATPNRRLVALADALLRREGRMNQAIAQIGRGADCFEGVCFTLAVPPVPLPSASARPLTCP